MLALGLPARAAPAGPPRAPLLVALPLEAPRDAVKRTILQPFMQVSRQPVTEWKAAAAAPVGGPAAPGPDLAVVPAREAEAGCRGRSLAKLDWSRLGRDRFLPLAATECGAGAWIAATLLAWDRDKVSAPPGWTDFWDVARRPGRRGLPRHAAGTLEFALMADGVAAADVYRTLRTDEGVDRAFRRLDQLKPYIAWWEKPDQPAQWLLSGNVLMVAGPAASLAQAAAAAGEKRHLGLQWAQAVVEPYVWVVPSAAAHPGDAALLLMMASDIGRQASLAQTTFLAPALRDATNLLAPQEAATSAAFPANLASALPADAAFWAERGAKLEQRFQAWTTK